MEDHIPNQYILKQLPRYYQPNLPELPAELISNKPIQVGKCPAKAKLLMFLAALPISFVAGVVAHFIGIAVAFIGYQLGRFLLAMMEGPGVWNGEPFCWIVIIGILAGYPWLVGALNHEWITFLGKKAHCHKPKTAAWAGLLNGIPLYFGHILMSFLIVKDFSFLTFTSAQLEPVFPVLAELVGVGGPFAITFCILEFILLMLGSVLGGLGQKEEVTVFCKQHQAWYGDWVKGRYPASIIEQLEQRLINGVPLKPFEQDDAFTYPHVELAFRRCSISEDCDVEVKVELWWVTGVNDQGQFVDTYKNEVWFDAMLPADLANAMIAELDLKPQDKKKKKK